MKKFGLLLLGIILGALAMYFYCSKDVADMESGQPTVAPKGIITSNQAMVLDKAYDIKHRIINDSLFKKSTDGGDNRSSWWPIEDIQNFINHAENQAGELGYTMDGLRVYLGAYPKANGQEGLTTMFIVPTGKSNKSNGSMFPMLQGGSGDIKGADGLNFGQSGYPPGANYPQ
ncbi:hypothetical protein [uncultured Winogradskyella sp.]|uniref:hypothetical protein n=1 Tax=uncultured Winogradskyella sp. TaxID=395353 RepID=UPI00262E20F6|nr:hypothetical protein [uncultured Winogradskyella sp.]